MMPLLLFLSATRSLLEMFCNSRSASNVNFMFALIWKGGNRTNVATHNHVFFN